MLKYFISCYACKTGGHKNYSNINGHVFYINVDCFLVLLNILSSVFNN